MPLESILHFSHQLVAAHVQPGDTAIDATVGQGHDTLLLASLTGDLGSVYGFDIQAAALAQAKVRLEAATPAWQHVHLIERSHEHMLEVLPAELRGGVAAVMFNLGYLPGGDHRLVTEPRSTVAAVSAALQLLRKGGLLTLVVYTGHDGALAEAQAVESWATQLQQKQYQVLRYQFINQINNPPYFLAIVKK